MMNFHVMTLFPDMINNAMSESITGRAIKAGHIAVNAVNIRDFSENKHNRVDDYPYGGGAGMVMQAGPVYRCYKAIEEEISTGSVVNAGEDLADENKTRVIYLSPQGKTFNQEMAKGFAKEENLIFLCGHYEGIDERVLDEIVTDHLSIGDYVLTGGELPAMVMIDTIARLVPGVLNNSESAEYDSFQDGLLEYPQYTRPEIWHDKQVPEVLLSGHHGNIEKWRRQQSLKRTFERRPELLEQEEVQEALTKKDREYLSELENSDDTL